MKKIRLLYISFMMVLVSFTYSYAISFTFYGTDEGGVGSAKMDITVSDTTLSVTLKNTSPTTLIDGSGPNISCISGFGFDFYNYDSLNIESWRFTALDTYGSTVVIGGSGTSGFKWGMFEDNKIEGVKMDYLAHVIKPNGKPAAHDGALYNPLLISNPPSGGATFFTTAYLTMVFNETPDLALYDSSVYVRMMRVGKDAEGSLKLYSPEPGTIALLASLASGLFGFAGLRKRFTK